MNLQEAIDGRERDERRRGEVFRKARVEAIDDGVDPPLYTVNGRAMPSVYLGLAVGDVVTYVDQPDGFVVGKFAGS